MKDFYLNKLTFGCNSLVKHEILIANLFSLLIMNLVFFSLLFDDMSVITPIAYSVLDHQDVN